MLVSETRVIAVSCGIEISTVHHLALSQYMRLTDRWTDRHDRIATAILWAALHAYPQHAYRHVGITSTPVHMTTVVK